MDRNCKKVDNWWITREREKKRNDWLKTYLGQKSVAHSGGKQE